jgi:hypothetical protein
MEVLFRNSALRAWATTAARTDFSVPRNVAVVKQANPRVIAKNVFMPNKGGVGWLENSGTL